MLVHQRVLWMETQATPPRYGCCSFGCQHHQLLGCRVAHRWFLEPPKKVRSYWTSGNFHLFKFVVISLSALQCLILFIPNSWGGCGQVTPTFSKPAARHCIGRRHWTSSGSCCSRSSGRMSWAAWQRRGGWGLDGVGFARFGAVFSMNLFSRCCFLYGNSMQFHGVGRC
jgi:hypothetical protein